MNPDLIKFYDKINICRVHKIEAPFVAFTNKVAFNFDSLPYDTFVHRSLENLPNMLT